MINIPDDCLGDEELEHIKVANEILIVDDRRKYLSVIMNRIAKVGRLDWKSSFGYYQKRMNGDSTMSRIRSLLETKRRNIHL